MFETKKSITTDNFFTSVPTVEFFLQKNITMTGTLRKKKPDIPAVMEDAKERDVLLSKFFFSVRLAVVSYVPKKIRLFVYCLLNILIIHCLIKTTRNPT